MSVSLEYIESSGTQWINTGILPDYDNFRICVDCMVLQNDGRFAGALFGGDTDSGGVAVFCYTTYDFDRHPIGNFLNMWVAPEGAQFPLEMNVRRTIEIETRGSGTVDYTIRYNGDEVTGSGAYPEYSTIYLFAMNGGYDDVTSIIPAMRLYGCQIWQDDVLVRDYRPAIYNGTVGLYDNVSKQMFQNAGSGDFIAGPVELGLITDRTKADVRARNAKGTYNASDLNRVESTVEYIAYRTRNNPVKDYAAECGVAWDSEYDPPWAGSAYTPTVKTDWAMTDIPTQSQMAWYLGNVEALRQIVPGRYPAIPGTMDRLDYTGANAIEESLVIADNAITDYITDMEATIDRVAATIDLGWAMGLAHTGLYGGM